MQQELRVAGALRRAPGEMERFGGGAGLRLWSWRFGRAVAGRTERIALECRAGGSIGVGPDAGARAGPDAGAAAGPADAGSLQDATLVLMNAGGVLPGSRSQWGSFLARFANRE